MTEQEVVSALRRGGKDRTAAISYLYRTYARKFLSYFLKHRVPRQHAEELVQDAFVSVVRNCENFRGDTRFDAWMWAIVRNLLADHFRRQRPEDPFDDDGLEGLADTRPGPDDVAVEDVDTCVRREYARFAEAHPDRAEILARVAFDGWSTGDVAAALRRTPGAAREYLSQCRKKLKEFLKPCLEYLGH
jgi:RNA polymerase sigma-70 factor (ECF subfamily)